MAKLEEEVLERFPLKPLAFSRYLDDIFMIWPHSINELKLFIQTFNCANTSIKVTEEINEYSVNFLDLTIFKGPTFQESGYLDYKTYFKPTCSHDLIRNDSFHPKSVGPGVIKSQIIRFHGNSSRPEYIDSTCRTAFLNTHKLGYSKRKLRKIKTDTLHELNHRDPTGSTPCRSHTCHTCKYILPGNIVTINHTPHNIRTKLDCSSTHLIYTIQCSKCNLFYIGQTTQTLRQRFSAHRSDIRTHKNTTIALHFITDLITQTYDSSYITLDIRMMAYISFISVVLNTLTHSTPRTPHNSYNLLELGMMAHIFLQPSELKTHAQKNPQQQMTSYNSYITLDTRMMAYISLISIVLNTLNDLTPRTSHNSDNLLDLGMMAHIFLQPSELKHTPIIIVTQFYIQFLINSIPMTLTSNVTPNFLQHFQSLIYNIKH